MLERLKILLDNNVISQETYDYILEIQKNIFSNMSLEEANEKEQMFWTHLAMAIDRTLKNNQLDEIDPIIKAEVESQDNFGQANELVKKIEEMISHDFGEAERTYILLHACNVLRVEEKMIRFVVGGQLDKKNIAEIIRKIGGDQVEVEIKNDLDAVLAMKNGQHDYYLGACETGSGGALAMAIAMLGSEKTVTVSRPGSSISDEEILRHVNEGKIAFGFTATYVEKVVPVIVKGILDK